MYRVNLINKYVFFQELLKALNNIKYIFHKANIWSNDYQKILTTKVLCLRF